MSLGMRFSLDLPWHSLVVAAIALIPPPVAFVLLLLHPNADIVFGSHAVHFVIVTIAAGAALVLALLVALAARQIPDARTYFLAMGFVAMAGIFLAHGLATAPFFSDSAASMTMMNMPGMTASAPSSESPAYDGYGYDAAPAASYGESAYGTQAVSSAGTADAGASAVDAARLTGAGLSARLSLAVSAVFFALAVTQLGRRASNEVTRHLGFWSFAVLGAVSAYVIVALAMPGALLWMPLASGPLSWGVAALTALALAFAAWRFLQAYRFSYLPLQGTMALSMAWLIEAQWFMVSGPLWHLSWWEYHVVMLAGFLATVGGLLWQYRLTGDLSAVIAGLFLRETVSGIRAGDPEALWALGAAVAAKDGETSAHVERVSRLSIAIGERLGLTDEQLEVLRWAGRLHDLGKIGVPDSILLKPGKLTEEEFRVMRIHSMRGWQVTRRAGVLAQAATAIRGHHERWNGSGYPDGLAGEAIPLLARIIAVADVWDALTAARPYRGPMRPEEAAELIRRDAGVLFDARCVAELFAALQLPLTPLIGAGT